MDRRKLAVVGLVVALAAVVLRRLRRRDAVEVSVDESGGRPVAIEGPDEREVSTDEEVSATALEAIEGIGPAYAERLREAGVEDAADLEAADAATIASETGIGERRIRGWIERAGDED